MSHQIERTLEEVTIDSGASVTEALSRLDQAGTGALVVLDSDGRLFGLLTDGDIRRAILRGVRLEDACGTIASRNPVTARDSISARDALHTMTQHDINHLLLLDGEGMPEGLLLRTNLLVEDDLTKSAKKRLDTVSVDSGASVTEALSRLDQAGTGALVVLDSDGKLFGLLTDGDIRRAILRGVRLEDACGTIASRNPVTARGPISARDALHEMIQHDINHLPIVDEGGRLTELLLRRDLVDEASPSLPAVIMAGGFGTRLLPLTVGVPKPMLPVGDRPLLERTLRQLRRSGIKQINLTTHYLPDSIVQHFGDGEAFGVSLTYSNEDQPLGTAGGVKLMERPSGPFLVINGDVLTAVSFQEMLQFHRKYNAELTVGVRQHTVDVPFGVVECEEVHVVRLREKPSLTLLVNAGVYLLEPSAYDSIPDGERFDMTDLISKLINEERSVVSFPIVEYWQDVGRYEDYQQAQLDAGQGLI